MVKQKKLKSHTIDDRILKQVGGSSVGDSNLQVAMIKEQDF
jgi:hypothetical protein